jgi:hypothetical protein
MKTARRIPLDASVLYSDIFITIEKAAGWDADNPKSHEEQEIDCNTVLQALVSVTACFIASLEDSNEALLNYFEELRHQVKTRKDMDARIDRAFAAGQPPAETENQEPE